MFISLLEAPFDKLRVIILALIFLLLLFAPIPSRRKNLISFYSTKTIFNESARSRILESVGPYIPPWWYSSILGTIFAFGHDSPIDYFREVVVHDKSSFVVDWFPNKPQSSNGIEIKVILFNPGLGLSSKNVYNSPIIIFHSCLISICVSFQLRL
jgi:hypothetical protein